MEDDDEQIRVKDKIPADLQSVFPFEYFNEMQSALLKQVYDSDVNMTVAAPTGSGKTVVCELAILRLLKKYRISELKCIMITPNKALCQQKMKEWNKCFGQLGLSVLELTGDSFLQHSLRLVARANIIITTPEKWDCMTRSWRQHVFLLGAIDLLIIDEIHHLGEDNRGATLEAVIVRMRTLNNIYQEKVPQGNVHRTPMRIVSLSAALPNVSDIGEWLQCGYVRV
jgi:ATP-dependent DNA helicase HFM1/MER3